MVKKRDFKALKKMSPHALISMKWEENATIMNKNTLIAYERVWRDFSEYLDAAEVHTFNDFTKAHLLHFLQKYKSKPFSYNQARSAILKILIDIEDDYDVVVPRLESVKRQVSVKKVKSDDRLFLTKSQLNKVRETADVLYMDRAVRERNLFIYDLLAYTMLRIDEVALIQLSDINLTTSMLGVRGKGADADSEGNRIADAHIKLSPKLISQAIEYVRSWRTGCKGESSKPFLEHPATITEGMPLFTSLQGNKMNMSGLKKIICDMVSRIFINENKVVPRNHGPHSIRRSVATIKYNQDKDIIKVQKLLRHASHITTMRYIGIDQHELDEAYLEEL